MAWEKFKRGKFGRGGKFASVSKSGVILISRIAYEELLKDVPAVELLYDDSRKVIGLAPMKKKTDDSYPIRAFSHSTRKNNPLYVVTAMSFFKTFNIDFGDTKRFEISKSENGLIEVDLNNELERPQSCKALSTQNRRL